MRCGVLVADAAGELVAGDEIDEGSGVVNRVWAGLVGPAVGQRQERVVVVGPPGVRCGGHGRFDSRSERLRRHGGARVGVGDGVQGGGVVVVYVGR